MAFPTITEMVFEAVTPARTWRQAKIHMRAMVMWPLKSSGIGSSSSSSQFAANVRRSALCGQHIAADWETLNMDVGEIATGDVCLTCFKVYAKLRVAEKDKTALTEGDDAINNDYNAQASAVLALLDTGAENTTG